MKSTLRRTTHSITLLILSLFALNATADVIIPVSVNASSTFGTYQVNDLINGDGLTGALHGSDYTTMWLSGEGIQNGPTLTFDLGGTYDISGTSVWQFNAVCCELSRGVQDFDIYSSTDGISFSQISSESMTESPGGMIAAQNFLFSAPGSTHIRFIINSNFGNTRVGLSEVQFLTSAAAVPEPSIFMILGLGLGVLIRRQRRSKA